MDTLLQEDTAMLSSRMAEKRYFSIGFAIEKILIWIKIMQFTAELKYPTRSARPQTRKTHGQKGGRNAFRAAERPHASGGRKVF
jgi:hypothetical protein